MLSGGSMGLYVLQLYLVRSHKMANNLATTEAIEKNKRRFGIPAILECFDVCLTKFENYQIFLFPNCSKFVCHCHHLQSLLQTIYI
jgi:hypothetical protein